jgi:hypothetical protein
MKKYDLCCEICQGLFDIYQNIPKVLACGHTICLRCIERMKNKDIARCPFDRKILDFDDDKLMNNYYIISLIEGAIKETPLEMATEIEKELKITPKPVINTPGWKNTLDGFIMNDILYTVESNGFIYCTDLKTGEWWFLYLSQFHGKFFFTSEDKMFLIDLFGNLYKITNKNYYLQFGKKNSWRETIHACVLNKKLYTVESNYRLYETDLETGKWKELGIRTGKYQDKKDVEDEDSDEFMLPDKSFNGITALVSSHKNLFMSNNKGELYLINKITGEVTLLKNNFPKTIDIYTNNNTHMYFLEKNGKTIYRLDLNIDTLDSLFEKLEISSKEGLISFKEIEKFYEIEETSEINKIVSDNEKLVLFDKTGDIIRLNIEDKQFKRFQCLFMLRNCHYNNTCLMGDGELLILDPIRLSINKLNILTGTEVIILHSIKFIYSIKLMFATNTKIYFVDLNGNLYFLNEGDKKVSQLGNSGILKYISSYAVYRNHLLTIENYVMYKTNLNDGTFVEIKNEYLNNCHYFLSDGISLLLINKEDDIFLMTCVDNQLKLKQTYNYPGISKIGCLTFFKKTLIYYDYDNRRVEGICLENSELKKVVLIEDFPEISFFINNMEILSCILKDGVIYKLCY